MKHPNIQSCLKVSWAGKLLYTILFQVDGKYTINQTNPSFKNLSFAFSFSTPFPFRRKKVLWFSLPPVVRDHVLSLSLSLFPVLLSFGKFVGCHNRDSRLTRLSRSPYSTMDSDPPLKFAPHATKLLACENLKTLLVSNVTMRSIEVVCPEKVVTV
jgi:hypothetical protein